MKTFIFSLLVVCFSLTGFAQTPAEDDAKDKFEELAFKLVFTSPEKIKLVGDVQPKENLPDMVKEAKAYGEIVAHALGGFFGGHDDKEDDEIEAKYKALNIIDLSVECNQVKANCMLSLNYKNGISSVLNFELTLDENKLPVSLVGNQVTLSHKPTVRIDN